MKVKSYQIEFIWTAMDQQQALDFKQKANTREEKKFDTALNLNENRSLNSQGNMHILGLRVMFVAIRTIFWRSPNLSGNIATKKL